MNPNKLWERNKFLKRSLREADEYLQWLLGELQDTLVGGWGPARLDPEYFREIRLEVDRIESSRSWRNLGAYLRKAP